ncbi:MAG: hypothetical protein WCO60_16695 [Verrucomicrobiota bacterium]
MRSFILLVTACATPLVASAQTKSFDQTYAKLKAGHTYQKQPTGLIPMPTREGDVTLDNALEVPVKYNPTKPIPLRISLHGGVERKPPGPGEPAARPLGNRTPAGNEIVLHPRGYDGFAWWHPTQVDNILKLINQVKRDYNIDESRIYVTGVSDGGSGVYFLAMREATLWSACLPLNGHPLVIASPRTKADGQFYPGNLVNSPIFAVNGGRDPLYPAAGMEGFMTMIKRAGVSLEWHVRPTGEHNVDWWPEERPGYEAFLAAHPRVAHPAEVSWETERTDRYNRFRWVVIDQLGKRESDVPLDDINCINPGAMTPTNVFPRALPSGRVDAVRKGNTFEVRTRGVQEFTLLLSPEVVNFSKPIKVTVNGKSLLEGIAAKDVNVLEKWAAKDNDRTMLYGAELKIKVP